MGNDEVIIPQINISKFLKKFRNNSNAKLIEIIFGFKIL